ncbi:cupin domain-containing protein [Spirillospora sp. CA-294931]|uniref:cupin domain-containing protein n=1 Tax=Spirillospora sp. CA-294931 TaxID=3240042 RepID=UPI003D8B1DA9
MLGHLVSLLATELDLRRPGSDGIVFPLVDAMLLYILRAWLDERSDPAPSGWAGALADPAVGQALHAMHARLAHPWTVEQLAAVCPGWYSPSASPPWWGSRRWPT